MKTLKTHLWVVAIALGLTFLALSTFFVVMGLDAKATIREALAEENVFTAKDTTLFGVPAGVLVNDAKTAEAEAEVIKMHSIDRYGLYAEMERDDPNREAYLKGLTLRNALNLAVMGFGVANLAIGTGAVILLLGTGTLALVVPVLYRGTESKENLNLEKRGRPVDVMAAGD